MKLDTKVLAGALTTLFAILKAAHSLPLAEDQDISILKAEIVPEPSVNVRPDAIKHSDTKNAVVAAPASYLASAKVEIPDECSKDVNVIQNYNDLIALSKCEVVSGSISVKDYNDDLLDFGNIESVRGGVHIHSAKNLQKIQGDKLQSISGKMQLHGLTSLTSIRLPSLNSVSEIDWRVLPILNSVSFDSGVKNVESITIADTALTGFSGFEVEILKTLNINNNRYLETITSNVKKVTEKLEVAGNSKGVSVNLSSLVWANNITFRDVSSLDIKSLEEVEDTAGFINNNFQSLKAPKLKSIGGTLIIDQNKALNEIEFPALKDVGGGLMVLKNPEIVKMALFPKLEAIGGAIKIDGAFKDITMPKLRLVKGSASVKTTAASFDCARWIRSDASAVVRGGKIECSADSKSSETIHIDNDGLITGSMRSSGHSYTSEGSALKLSLGITLFGFLSMITF